MAQLTAVNNCDKRYNKEITFAKYAQMNRLYSISFRNLQLFIQVFETQSFSIVARREGVSASMVSRSIQQLEDALDQQLFYRNTRAVIPTDAGQLVAGYARQILERLKQAQQQLQDKQLEPTGIVRLNAPVFFGQKHLAPWLAGLSRKYPKLQIELTLTDDFIDPHRDGTDLLFRLGVLADSSFHARILARQTYYLAASPDYIRRHGQPKTVADITSHQALIYHGSSGPNRWLFKAAPHSWEHATTSAILTSNNADTLLTAALSGMGLVLFPDWLIGEDLKQGKLVRLLAEYEAAIHTEPQYLAAIYPQVRHPPLNIRAVIDYFVEVFGSPPYWQLTQATASN